VRVFQESIHGTSLTKKEPFRGEGTKTFLPSLRGHREKSLSRIDAHRLRRISISCIFCPKLLLGRNPSVRPKNLSTLFFLCFSICRKMQIFEPFASISRPAGTHELASAFSNRVKFASVFACRRRVGQSPACPIGCEPDSRWEIEQRHSAHLQKIASVHFGGYFVAVLELTFWSRFTRYRLVPDLAGLIRRVEG
jgi:hypothetical protein